MVSEKALITSRDPKGLDAVSIFELAYNEAKLNNISAKKLIEKGDQLKKGTSYLIKELTSVEEFVDEVIKSIHRYPVEYQGPKPIKGQIIELSGIFNLEPERALRYVENLPNVPDEAEGWFAVPDVNAVAKKFFPTFSSHTEKYCRAVNLVHDRIKSFRLFFNYQNVDDKSNYLKMSYRTQRYLKILADEQLSDILVLPAQLGMLHAGKSVRRARETFAFNEFGLGAFAVGSILLTHPERITKLNELDMFCSGDEFSVNADGNFSSVPIYFFSGRVEFDECWEGKYCSHYGSVTGFLPL